MKSDTKISLTIILWLPAFIIGTITGLIIYGFINGFDIYQEINEWFNQSECLERAEKND